MASSILNADLLAAMLRVATPLLFVALGVAVTLKAGIFNIAIEGMMLIAAFLAVVLSTYFKSLLIGMFFTILITVTISLIYGLVIIHLKADHIIAGLGINLFAAGITSWILQSVMNSPGGYSSPLTPVIPTVTLPLIDSIPFVSTILQGQNIVTYSSWIVALIVYLFLHHSKYGLRLRATGEHPVAATTAGISPVKWQYISLIICGVLVALGGTALSMGNIHLFTKGMTAGRGFISFAAAAFAGGSIPGTVIVTFLFALFSSLSIRLGGLEIPTRFIQMIPYFVTLTALVVSRRRIRL
jgi:simple sugar transport system permease protein